VPTDDFRCSLASAADDEPMAGTALTDTEMLLVECPGPWGHDAVAENRLPEAVRHHLVALDLKVLLIRRHKARAEEGVRVFHARRSGEGFEVRTALLATPEDLPGLDLNDLQPHDADLWLVCTNAKRDRCCALEGRPVTAEIERRWPEDTWEVSHLGGHRFAGTLLALPSGWMLGRLDAASAVAACEGVVGGEVPVVLARGRAGRPGADQVRELHVLAGGSPNVEVVTRPGPPRIQSCGGGPAKPTVVHEVVTPASC
jgi:hypothetical protein